MTIPASQSVSVVPVHTGAQPYDILIGCGLLLQLALELSDTGSWLGLLFKREFCEHLFGTGQLTGCQKLV